MEIRNLNTFLHAASLQNITRAAAELGYSQSAVSVQIRQLEQELGMPLFDRIGKNVYLTDFGRSLVPYARSAVAAVAAVENFGKSDAVLGGAIRVGITDSLFELLMKPLLPAYHARFPKVRVELLVDTTVNLTQLLQQGSIDAMCVIDDPLPPAQWHIRQQTEVPIVLAASPSHPLVRRSEVAQDIPHQPHGPGQQQHQTAADLLTAAPAPADPDRGRAACRQQPRPHVALEHDGRQQEQRRGGEADAPAQLAPSGQILLHPPAAAAGPHRLTGQNIVGGDAVQLRQRGQHGDVRKSASRLP